MRLLGSKSKSSAAKAFSQVFGFSVSINKHNRWSRIIPNGLTCTDLKNRLQRTTLTERERSVCRLVLDTAAPEFFTVTVQFIANSIGFSAKKTWPKVRNMLVEKGLLTCIAQKLQGGQSQWHLNFDFTPLAAGFFDFDSSNLSTASLKKGGSRARAGDPPQTGVSRDATQSGGSRDASERGGSEPKACKPKKTTSRAAAFLFLEKEECLSRFTDTDRVRIAEALGTADRHQLDTFIRVFSGTVETARSQVGLAIYLARLAGRGELMLETALQTLTTQSPASVCDAKQEWNGQLNGPNGVVARALQDAGLGQLRNTSGGLLSIVDSASFWEKVDNGELDFVSS